jgi:hypothetical protein
MSQKSKKALPLLPEEEREIFPKGKPEHPEKLMRDAGEFSLFFNRNIFTKRAFYLIRNYWRLGEKRIAIIATMLYIIPIIFSFAIGFMSAFFEDVSLPTEALTLFAVIAIGGLILWIVIYYFAPNVMVSHQIPLYEEFLADYNDVRHDILNTSNRKKKKR